MMKKFLLLLLAAAALVMAFVSCSDDPRVAPKRIYIVDTDDMQNRVFYSNEIPNKDGTFGSRVIYMKPKETVQLDAITNRLGSDSEIVWSSDMESTAIVDNNGFVTAMNHEGVAEISVSAPGVKKQAVCKVIVQLNNGSSFDPDMKDGMKVVVSTGGLGGELKADGALEVYASTEEELQAQTLTFTWEDECDVHAYDHFVWSVSGVTIPGTKGQAFTYRLTSFGNYEIHCEAWAQDVFGNVYRLGDYKLVVRTRYKAD
ncbi:MAG: Ig-like domain-containing protein [Spirochaetales bacterium]|nr:Ig-like domain-containing protein [Candidatus Physcosoma equi]